MSASNVAHVAELRQAYNFNEDFYLTMQSGMIE